MTKHIRWRKGWAHLDTYINGRRVREQLNTRVPRVAAIIARTKIARYEREGVEQVTGRYSLEGFAEKYEPWADQNKGAETRRNEKRELKRFTEFAGVTYLDELTPELVDRYVTERVKSGVRATTVHTNIRCLKAIFGAAVRWNYLPKNPFSRIPLPLAEEPQPRILSLDESTRILAAAYRVAPHYAPAIEMLLWTGLRRSELLALEWDGIDWKRGVIVLTRTKRKRSRVVPMIGRVTEILRPRKHLQRPFADVGRDGLRFAFEDAREAAKLPNARLKDLRSSYETYLIELANISDNIANKITGHSRRIADLHYIGLPMTELRTKLEAIERISQRMSGKRGHKTVTKRKAV